MLLLLGAALAGPIHHLPPADTAPTARFDIDVQDADLHATLRLLADIGDINLVVPDTVSGSVTVRLERVTWEEAFTAILAMKGIVAVATGTTWTVR